jgi:hypothetical protein
LLFSNDPLSKFKIKKCKEFLELTDDDFNSYMMDNRMSQTIKKRIMMIHMYIKSENQASWSRKADVILHKWIVRQTKNDDNTWSGNFSLIVQHGNDRMMFKGNDHVVKIYCVNMRDLKLAAKLIKFASVMLQMNEEDFVKKCERGNWLLEETTVIPTNEGFGFKISHANIPEPSFDIQNMVVDEDFTSLINTSNETIYKIGTGYLRSTIKIQIPDDLDFDLFGLKWNDLNRIGAFNDEFDILRISPDERLSCLKDLNVIKPRISELTKKKLEIEDFDNEESKYEELSIDVESKMDDDDYMMAFINQEPASLKMEEEDPILSILADFKVEDLFKGFEKVPVMIKTKQIWNRIKSLKCTIIATFCCDMSTLNKRTIHTLKKRWSDYPTLYWSLIKVYDSIYTSEELSSPRGMNLKINDDFSDKFLDS